MFVSLSYYFLRMHISLLLCRQQMPVSLSTQFMLSDHRFLGHPIALLSIGDILYEFSPSNGFINPTIILVFYTKIITLCCLLSSLFNQSVQVIFILCYYYGVVGIKYYMDTLFSHFISFFHDFVHDQVEDELTLSLIPVSYVIGYVCFPSSFIITTLTLFIISIVF